MAGADAQVKKRDDVGAKHNKTRIASLSTLSPRGLPMAKQRQQIVPHAICTARHIAVNKSAGRERGQTRYSLSRGVRTRPYGRTTNMDSTNTPLRAHYEHASNMPLRADYEHGKDDARPLEGRALSRPSPSATTERGVQIPYVGKALAPRYAAGSTRA